MSRKVFSGGKVHVCAEQCATCIFHPGNLMQLEIGRVRDMVNGAKQNESCIPCHETIYGQRNQQAICRGFWDQYRNEVVTLRLAQMIGIVQEVEFATEEGATKTD